MDVVMRMARVYDDGVLQDRLIKSQLIIMASWYCQVLHLEYLDAPTSDHSGMVTQVGSPEHAMRASSFLLMFDTFTSLTFWAEAVS